RLPEGVRLGCGPPGFPGAAVDQPAVAGRQLLSKNLHPGEPGLQSAAEQPERPGTAPQYTGNAGQAGCGRRAGCCADGNAAARCSAESRPGTRAALSPAPAAAR